MSGRGLPALLHRRGRAHPGHVDLREPEPIEGDLVLPALGITSDTLAPATRVACDRLGLLGCYVYSAPTPTGRVAARMVAPSIGVAEDVANANSTACPAAYLAGRGIAELAVDMGDSLGSPATITATARPGPSGPLIRLGGTAEVTRIIRLPWPAAFRRSFARA
ncbi:PhzF family phenazine biosynthesis protein [Nonomuraea zeae]|uniref:PhzF family phenazine biosynthesis protein n=1 Tax=Nonomuraea zeae TaxID=1642303 RepID=UPI001981E6D8|nr:PhzF family phenazine biosynthesis protein [Nonomuraea zeae]